MGELLILSGRNYNGTQTQDIYRYRVVLSYDSETGQTIAEVPALDIADCGADASEALSSVQEMIAFHLECLTLEGKPVPRPR